MRPHARSMARHFLGLVVAGLVALMVADFVKPHQALASSISTPGGVAIGLNGPATSPFVVRDASGATLATIDCSGAVKAATSSVCISGLGTCGQISWANGPGQIVFNTGIATPSGLYAFGNNQINISSQALDGASAVGLIFNNAANTLATAGAKLISIKNNSTEKAYIDKDGFISSGAKPVPSVTTATVAQGIEASTQALTAGAATVTFPTAFSAVPVCTCTDQTAAAAVKCAPTPTTLPIAGTSTDTIAWICLGAR